MYTYVKNYNTYPVFNCRFPRREKRENGEAILLRRIPATNEQLIPRARHQRAKLIAST